MCRNLRVGLIDPSDLEGEDIGGGRLEAGRAVSKRLQKILRFRPRPLSKAVSRKIGKDRGQI